jgi:hypothetical protein
MGSDRARVTYDPKQQYRSVVMQQGRVTLEADWNEAWQINDEELRKETLDIVGPCGTPDGGYKVDPASTSNAPFDFTVGSGTIYVGGLRLCLDNPVQYSNQPDWRDIGPEDPDWVDPASFVSSPGNPPGNEFVYLLVREQEVSAVEDYDLKDVALGGPDTAQRTRLLQRFPRVACQGTDCVSGLVAAQAKWQSEGLYFDPDTMRLDSWGTLTVSFTDQGSTTDPCQPQATGGYLDPDNQLIRVQISGVDPATGNPKFVWGFDDASFLYRINVDPNNPQNLVFQSVPVDSQHQPVTGQAVEVLRTAADLPNGGDIAATSGFVFTLAQNYDPDAQLIVMPTGITLPADFTNPNQSPANQLFLRVWQQEIIFTPGSPVPLGDTGLLVTLAPSTAGQPFHLGDYWMFAVRPATPQTVYPERYQKSAQPPDGPRLWACPLGVIAWSDTSGILASDCRNSMCNLVDLCKRQQGCCTITVRPQDLNDVTTLQSVINRASSPTMLVQAANAGAPGNNISVQISNFNLNVTPPTFDPTVTETDVYLGLTTVGGNSNSIAAIIGDENGGPNDGLAHVIAKSVNPQLSPFNNQVVTFAAGDADTKAQAKVLDGANQQIIFVLEARNPGVDGNITTATISNVSAAPTTFDLTVTWQKTLAGLNMATLFPSIQSSLGYAIVAQPPTTVTPGFPAAGIMQLSGGAEPPDPSVPQDATFAQALLFGNPAKICLRSGSYILPRPLVFGLEQSNITLEACGDVTLTTGARNTKDNAKLFLTGMLHVNGADNVAFRGLKLDMPRIVFFQASSSIGGVDKAALELLSQPELISLDSSIALAVSGCRGLTVEDCIFQFPTIRLNDVLFAVAIFAGANCSDITLKRNLFDGPAAIRAVATSGSTVPTFALACGYVQADSLQGVTLTAGGDSVSGGTLVPSSLDNINFTANHFENLAFPVVLVTTLGAARFQDNVMRSCFTGFTILPLLASLASLGKISASDPRLPVLGNPAAQQMLTVAALHPRPATFVPSQTIQFAAAKVVNPAAKAPNAKAATAAKAPVAASIASRISLVNRPITSIVKVPLTKPSPVASGDAAKLVKLSAINQRVAQVAANVSDFFVVDYLRNPQFSVEFANNDIEAFVAGGGSLWALTIVDIAALLAILGVKGGNNVETMLGSLTLTGNKFRNAWGTGDLTYAVSLMVEYSAVTGNCIMNQVLRSGKSLSIYVPGSDLTNIAITAVTGNVLLGPTNLPPRNPASLPDWTTYNFTGL